MHPGFRNRLVPLLCSVINIGLVGKQLWTVCRKSSSRLMAHSFEHPGALHLHRPHRHHHHHTTTTTIIFIIMILVRIIDSNDHLPLLPPPPCPTPRCSSAPRVTWMLPVTLVKVVAAQMVLGRTRARATRVVARFPAPSHAAVMQVIIIVVFALHVAEPRAVRRRATGGEGRETCRQG